MAEDWYVGRNGQQSGPFSAQQLRLMAVAGKVSPTDVLWKEGLPSWVPCSSVKGLFPEASPSSTLPPLRPAPRPAAPPPRSPLPSEMTGDIGLDPTLDSMPIGQWGSNSGVDSQLGSGGTVGFQYAGFLPRVGAALLDGLFVGLIGCVPSAAIAFMLFAANAGDPQGTQVAASLTNICANLIGILVQAIYSVTLDSSSKQGTWGKQIVGLKITDLEGRKIGAGRAIGRFLARYLSACTCGIGFLLPLFTEKKQTLHDLICGTLVLTK